jgi:[protein-PII] uridylyltransferase
VKIDNDTVSAATIIDVFSFDKVGLLFQIAKKIHELDLDVTYARTISYGIQVIGVYYVTDGNGNKIRDRSRLEKIKEEIYRALVEFLDP